MDSIDWKSPDYVSIFRRRIERLARLRENPASLPALKAFYRDNPANFINDWGVTFDAKNVERGLPALVPFILFPKQREWIEWVVKHWRTQQPGLTEKTRQMGFSWLSMATACTLCLFHDGMVVGFGSRKEEYVDKIGDPKSLIEKGRLFMRYLPPEFTGGWVQRVHAPHMRINFPSTGGIITGEAGDNIGRGNTTSIYFVDEAAFLERPHLVESSLSQTTNCRHDISTPNGMANSFAAKRFGGKIDVFTFHWRDDPRKDDAWYVKQVHDLDPVTVAQEIDIDYAASVEGVLIPSAWVQSAVDAHVKLSLSPTGERSGALDVADEGADMNAFCGAYGALVEFVDEWSGKGDDIFGTVQRACGLCDDHDYRSFKYDADGLGAGVRGDARIINDQRVGIRRPVIQIEAFRGSEAVFDPEGEDVKGRLNKDFFANRKAQAWWALRMRFQATHRAITLGESVSVDNMISISSSLPNRQKLAVELSQPTYGVNAVGKIVVNKTPVGARSPNLADAVMIRFSVSQSAPIRISDEAINRLRNMSRSRGF